MAFSLSIWFIKNALGVSFSTHESHPFSAPTERPETALNTIIALSTTLMHSTNSPTKSKYPGISRIFNFVLFHSKGAIECAKEGDEDKVFGGLTRLNEEDPTFKVEKNLETNQTLLYGIGEMHIDVIGAKLKNKFKAGITTLERKIAYRETIKKTIEVEGKHKKQTGGHGQFGHVRIRFAPLDDISQRFEFEDKIVGGAVPKGYIPAVERGLKDNLTTGTLANYPLTGIKATLYDGSYHNVDSSEMAFKIAAGLALKKLDTAKPILLEPIMHIAVAMPDEYMGDIIGDLNRRRGRIMGMTPLKGGQIVEAEVPESEVFKYATDLRSMTHARGSYTLKFVRYEEVPSNIATKVIAAAQKEDDDK